LWNTIKRTAMAPLQAQIDSSEKQGLELKQRTIELEAALRELETFSYSVSHDLRAPLRAIDGFSRIVLEDHGKQLDDEGRGYLQRVITAVHHMSELIDDLLALSRVSRREMVMTEVNLSELANDVISELQEQSPQRQVTVDIAPDLIVQGDRELLRVTLHNLLGNAWKYTSKKTDARIEFACNLQGSNPPLFCVRDNGIGFDMKYADKLFQPFQRLHAAAEFPGTGIGLATVARIMERHGGRIWAEGQPGLGTIVCFSLTAANKPDHLALAPETDKHQL
ncbi:MAG TPA: ATP-binding protein, partial [Gammaproteobacteria bacterium]|nr:ATP-binding protein [Gammaproteobacteria bacterium]